MLLLWCSAIRSLIFFSVVFSHREKGLFKVISDHNIIFAGYFILSLRCYRLLTARRVFKNTTFHDNIAGEAPYVMCTLVIIIFPSLFFERRS